MCCMYVDSVLCFFVFFSNLVNGMQIQLKQLFSMVSEYGFTMYLII